MREKNSSGYTSAIAFSQGKEIPIVDGRSEFESYGCFVLTAFRGSFERSGNQTIVDLEEVAWNIEGRSR